VRAVAAGRRVAVRARARRGVGAAEDAFYDPGVAHSIPGYDPYAASAGASGDYVGDLPLDDSAQDQGAIWNAIERLKRAGADFAEKYVAFVRAGDEINESQTGGEWASDFAALKSRADYVRGTIEGIAATVDSVTGWGKRVFGLNGVGVLPLIPISYAAVAGAVAVVIAVGNSMYQFTVNWNRAKAGLAPVAPGASIFSDGANLVKWVIAAGVLYYAAPEIMRVLKGRQ